MPFWSRKKQDEGKETDGKPKKGDADKKVRTPLRRSTMGGKAKDSKSSPGGEKKSESNAVPVPEAVSASTSVDVADTLSVVSPEPPKVKEATIALLGSVGTGKSTFMNLASGSSSRTIVTGGIEQSEPFELDGVRVTLVKLPEYDSRVRNNTDTLCLIGDWLVSEYKHGRQLLGVIFLYRITDPRVPGDSMRIFRLFESLCGPSAQPNSVFATTNWTNLVSKQAGDERMHELATKDTFLKPALDRGTLLETFTETAESAREIVSKLVGLELQPMQLQKELAEERKKVVETKAGEALLEDIEERVARFEKELVEMRGELENAKKEEDADGQEEIEQTIEQVVADIEQLKAEKVQLMQGGGYGNLNKAPFFRHATRKSSTGSSRSFIPRYTGVKSSHD